jgi:lipopolysaccharide assembly protein A
MPLLTWTVRLILFIVLLAFAVKNTDPVTLRFYFDLAWEGPLVIVLFGVLAIGALLGIAATIGALMRQRREIARLRRELRQGVSMTTRESPAAPPAIDA